jgi:hypothetical protein
LRLNLIKILLSSSLKSLVNFFGVQSGPGADLKATETLGEGLQGGCRLSGPGPEQKNAAASMSGGGVFIFALSF